MQIFLLSGDLAIFITSECESSWLVSHAYMQFYAKVQEFVWHHAIRAGLLISIYSEHFYSIMGWLCG